MTEELDSYFDTPYLPLSGRKIQIFDTTLRDGAQSEHISYSLSDKLNIAKELDELGVDFIEGGWPGSNPKDMRFFEEINTMKLQKSTICAFGSTHHPDNLPENDPNLRALVDSNAPVCVLFGKSWDFHVNEALRIPLETNLKMIENSIAFLHKQHLRKVIYDAEHFFDGFKANCNYAFRSLEAARNGGASILVLCDTNGGTMPEDIYDITKLVCSVFNQTIGIHPHNDSGLAVANALAAVKAGAGHVQGTINGFGERCGNVDLVPVIANLTLKQGHSCCYGADTLRKLTYTSKKIYEIGNIPPRDNQPYVGASAFAHKGGIHVSAVSRNASTYEHIKPELVGNESRVLVSELSGRANLLVYNNVGQNKFGLKDKPDDLKRIMKKIMELEYQGYSFESAHASLDVLIQRMMNENQKMFKLIKFSVETSVTGDSESDTYAFVSIDIGGKEQYVSESGNGPIHALDNALRKVLEPYYPVLKSVRLTDYRVRVINEFNKTASKVLVSIISTDGFKSWTTIGVSENIIDASWQALNDSIEFVLMNEKQKDKNG